MNFNNRPFLPGTDEQVHILLHCVNVKDKSVLVIGGGCEEIAKIFYMRDAAEVYLTVDDEDSLVQSRFALSDTKEIKVRLMEYDNTDFGKERFDLVYSQGSTGTKKRTRIVKEIFRILKPSGYLCTGEIVSLKKNTSQFVKDIWEINSLSPLYADDIKNFYLSRNFEPVLENDLSETLREFYSTVELLIKDSFSEPGSEEKYFKETAKTFRHEAGAYLKLGGDKYIGYRMLILKKAAGQV